MFGGKRGLKMYVQNLGFPPLKVRPQSYRFRVALRWQSGFGPKSSKLNEKNCTIGTKSPLHSWKIWWTLVHRRLRLCCSFSLTLYDYCWMLHCYYVLLHLRSLFGESCSLSIVLLNVISRNITISASDSCLMLDYVRIINFFLLIIIIIIYWIFSFLWPYYYTCTCFVT